MRYLDDGSCQPDESLTFFRDTQHRLGPLIAAEVHFPGMGGPYPYNAILRDDAGNEIWLSGIAAGHGGESSRMAMQILAEAGFPAEQGRAVFTDTSVRLRRDPTPTELRRLQRTAPDRAMQTTPELTRPHARELTP